MSDATPFHAEPLLSMTSPLGQGVLQPAALRLEEALSEPFLCVLDVVSARQSIDSGDLLLQPVGVAIRSSPLNRNVHGLVRRFAATGPVARGWFGYRIEVVPALWLLTQTQDCRIWEGKSTKAILEVIFSEHKLTFGFRVGETSPRPFTMQYNETDLAFVTRLMQEEGWFYWFTHETERHTMIVADTTASFAKIGGGPFTPGPGTASDVLSAWQPADAVTYGKIAMADYNPDASSEPPRGETPTTLVTTGGDLRDPFHWPARALDGDSIAQVTRRRMQAAEVSAALSHGAGFDPAFMPGIRIKVAEARDGETSEVMLARVSLQATDDSWRNGVNPPSCSNSFTAFPKARPWRPEQTVARPRMEGIYSAVVIGPQGQEIYTDNLGRVKLRFHWDRRGDATPGGGIWVRVMQPWAGPSAGWNFIPRVGSEVAVAFMDADPDRPVVVGQLRNSGTPPPWPLPGEKTRSGLRTRSTTDGGGEDYSELSFDDKKGAEQVFLHAQRDLKVEVENDAATEIDRHRSVTVAHGDDTVTVTQGSRTVDVPQGDHIIKSTRGNIAIKTATGAVSVEAMQSITLKVGQSSITLDQSGVTIKGMMVKVEGQAMVNLKAPIVKFDADGMLDAAGGVIMLN